MKLELTTSLTPGATSACQPKRRRMAWVRPPTGAALLHMRRHFAVPAGRPRHFAVRGYMEAATRERRGRHGLGSHARPPARATRGRYPERLPRPSPSSPCWMAWPMASTTRSCCAPCSVGCMPTHHAAVWKAARWSTPHVSTRELAATPRTSPITKESRLSTRLDLVQPAAVQLPYSCKNKHKPTTPSLQPLPTTKPTTTGLTVCVHTQYCCMFAFAVA